MDEGKKKVLIVEDDRNLRSVASLLLRGKGYDVMEAADGKEALGLVDKADLVLLDLFMPEMTGEEFLQKIREDGNYIPVVVMSAGYGREQGSEKLKDYGIVDFIEKPFTMAEVGEKMRMASKIADDMKFVHKATEGLKGFIRRQAR